MKKIRKNCQNQKMESKMKKLLILSAMLLISGCACLDGLCGDEEYVKPITRYRVSTNTKNCDYFDGKTCFRYVRREYEAPVEYVRYREPRRIYRDVAYVDPCENKIGGAYCPRQAVENPCEVKTDSCQETVRQVREPVEIVYKKTTYRTVYEPKTYEDVTYEKEPYRKPSCVTCE